jgi:hypothetical protein
LPWDIVASGSLQNYSGPVILADYAASNAEIAPTLGRNLAACGAAAVCRATTLGTPQTVLNPFSTANINFANPTGIPLIEPYTQFDKRVTQLDLRLSKIVKIGPKMRLQGNLDLYNLLNTAGVQTLTTTFGPRWLLPIQVQDARLMQVGGQLTF